MKLNEVKEGDKLVADSGFICIREGQVSEVFHTPEGCLAIPCDGGHHLLDGQIDDEGGSMIGLVKADPQ